MANLPFEPYGGFGFGRFFPCSDGSLPNAVRLRNPVPRLASVRFAITEHPTSEWGCTPAIGSFSWDEAPRFLLRDRDGIYGEKFNDAGAIVGH